ncbi:eukaryotic rRNA processing protein EBP2-domain-containing protein [Melampsora americana]|nr:eukaryotic rRNA processing protein EBP2-domain-containing protein [Melampsora americana]
MKFVDDASDTVDLDEEVEKEEVKDEENGWESESNSGSNSNSNSNSDEEEDSNENSSEEDQLDESTLRRLLSKLNPEDMTEEELLLLDQSQHHREGEGSGSEFEGGDRSESESGSESGSEEDESVIDLEEGEDDEEIEGIEYEKMHVDSDNEDLGAMVKRKVVKNNTKALVKLLELMKEKSSLQLDFFDTQTIQSTSTTQVPDVNDDIGLEVELYKQALQGAKEAYKTFQNSSKEFFRPDDYFAEMIKSDAHMEKIRLKLISEMENIKASEESKKKRDLKKFGKAIQVEKRLEREKESKRVKEGVKELRKSEVVFFLSSFPFLFLFFNLVL